LHAELLELQIYTQNMERFSTSTMVTSTNLIVTFSCPLPALLFMELRPLHTITIVYLLLFPHKYSTNTNTSPNTLITIIRQWFILSAWNSRLCILFSCHLTSDRVLLVLLSNSNLISNTHLLLLFYLHEGTTNFRSVDNFLPVDSSTDPRKTKYTL